MHPDKQEYIYLSDDTRGHVGRAIKVDMDAAMYLYCTIESDTYHGQQVIRDLGSLRNKIEPLSKHPTLRTETDPQLQKVHSFLRSMQNPMTTVTVGSVCASFYVEQKSGDSHPTVYISSVRIIGKGTPYSPGIYQKSMRGLLDKPKSRNLSGRAVFVSGAVGETPKDQMDRAKNLLGDDKNLALFYTPEDVKNDIGPWKNANLSRVTQETIREMKNVLHENQSNQVSWYVEREGAGVLMHALEGMRKVSLNKHEFNIVDSHASNTPKLIEKLSETNAKLNKGHAVEYTDMNDPKTMLGLAQQVDNVCEQIGTLKGYRDYAIITRRHLIRGIKTKGRLGAQELAKLNNNTGSLVSILRKRG